MWTRKFLALALAAFIVGCASPNDQQTQNAELIDQKNSSEHREAIENFADLAAAGNVDSMLEELGSVTLEINSREQLKTYLRNKIVPFFQGYKGVVKEGDSLTVADDRGNVGLQYFKFIETQDGQTQPFVITLFPEDGALAVTGIDVGKCFQGYHPHCP